jgi:hypothetical protein
MRLGGPTPWHLPKFPNGESTHEKRTWKNLELKAGEEFRVGLINARNECLVLIGFYWYACALTSDLWLLWRQYKRDTTPSNEAAAVQFRLLDLKALSPIKDIEAAVAASNHRGAAGIYYNEKPVAERDYLAAFPAGTTTISAPSEFVEAGNVLVLADIGPSAGYDAEVHMAILDFDFPNQLVTSYPQDWFNKGSLDFGYQWISQVWRDEEGRLCGEGVRIGEFRLDSTGQHLDRSFFGLTS